MASENTRKWAIIPEPNSMTVGEGTVLLPYAGRVNESIAIGDGDFLLAHQLVADIRSATGTDWDIATGDMWSGFIRLRIADSRDFDSQDGGTAGAYTLTINTDGITITGCDFEGVRNGVQTLRQLIRQNGAVLPELQIADAPACQIRGYYLDATRGRVPTLAWLKQWADKLCLYKYNQLQLYIEHTFAFDGMSETWRGSSPLTPADTLEFDQYCANLGIELVPSVSTFGHQYVAMRTQELRELGEFPEDADRPFSFIERMRHHTLNVADDRAFAFSAQLVDSYLQLFRSKRFNICADETFDLGKGKSKQEAQRVGVATLYATYVGKLCEHLSKQGREPMFWGDIAIEMPEILETLPNNVTLLNWQYEPEATDEKIQLVAQAGAKQIVCPAVWGWNALLPRIDDAWNNISRIARYGIDCGAEGDLGGLHASCHKGVGERSGVLDLVEHNDRHDAQGLKRGVELIEHDVPFDVWRAWARDCQMCWSGADFGLVIGGTAWGSSNSKTGCSTSHVGNARQNRNGTGGFARPEESGSGPQGYGIGKLRLKKSEVTTPGIS